MSLSRFPISLSFVLAFVEFAKVCLPFAGESRCFRSYWTSSLCVVERLRSTRIKVSHCFCVNPRRCHCAPIACDPPDLLPSLKVDICHCPGRLTESGTSSSRRNALVGDWAGAAIQLSGNSRLSRRRKLPSAGPLHTRSPSGSASPPAEQRSDDSRFRDFGADLSWPITEDDTG